MTARTYTVQTHRFRDAVAVSCGGSTVYLSARDASKPGAAITRAAREIKRGVKFVDSQVGTERPGVAFASYGELANRK